MNNWTKFWVGGVVMAAVAAFFFWLAVQPQAAPNFAPGSLGDTVREACRPDAPLAGRDLNNALACRDLAAQESMAVSTARMVWLSWAQIAVAVAGSVGILWTLLLSRRSADMTREALLHQRAATRSELRPRFRTLMPKIKARPNGGMRVEFLFENTGVGVARGFRNLYAAKIVPIEETQCQIEFDELEFSKTAGSILTHGTAGFAMNIGRADADRIRNDSHAVQIAFYCIYDDDFGGLYQYKSARVYWDKDLTSYKTLSGFELERPELKGRGG